MASRAISLMLAITAVCAMLIFGGCRRDFTTEADALRAEVMNLERQVEQLDRQNRELQSQIRRLQRVPDDVPEDIAAVTPEVVEITIGRLSNARDRSGDGVPDTAIVYINPVDGRGRFTQMVGTLTVRADYMPADIDPIQLGETSLSASEVRDAYRSGFMGTHYTIEVPINWPETIDPDAPDRPEHIDVRAVFTDGHTNERLEAHREVRIRWDARERRRDDNSQRRRSG